MSFMEEVGKKSTGNFFKNPLVIYLLKFGVVFCVAYFGTIAVEGLSAPGNY